MHDDRPLVEARLARVLAERLIPAQHAAREPLTLQVWHVPGEPVPVTQALTAHYAPFATGTRWGAPWSTSWFRATGTVPAAWAGRRVEAVFDLGFVAGWPGNQAEGLVHDLTGRALKGVAPRNQHVPVARTSTGGEEVGFLVEAAANPDILRDGFRPTPLGDRLTAPTDSLYTFAAADLAVLDEGVFGLVLDLQVLGELMTSLPLAEPRRHEVLRAVEAALDVIDLDDVAATAAAARAVLAPALARPAAASAHRISAVGHAHIDSAWLWPVRETIRKTSRTFASACTLAQEYPELVFAASSAQQYAWVREHHPATFERMREGVAAGTWAPVGGMWVEADGNMPGGEALARQLVLGKRFFRDVMGVECRGVWLPDSFGYTAAYPQLAVAAGMEWFLTQKISWNQTNRFPHHTFWWEGIDGTRVFTHFPPAETYNGTVEGSQLAHAVSTFADKGRATRSLYPVGHGDGGGGPTREMLERARRTADLEGSPRVAFEHPDAFFAAARAEYPDAPVWTGELYLELHRGTYTSQARTKAGNRRSEHLLRAAELWTATAAVHAPGYTPPVAALERLWQAVLLNQFHDILPGSSIAWVHREAEEAYGAIAAELRGIVADAAAALSRATPSTSDGTWVLNTAPVARTEVVVHDGAPVLVEVPAGGAAALTPVPAGRRPAPVRVEAGSEGTGADDCVVLDNGLVRITVAADGTLSSVLDLTADRELLAPGQQGNVLVLHPDLPNAWDAWDVDAHYRRSGRELRELESRQVTSSGPLLAGVRLVRRTAASTITQELTLAAGSRRLDIATRVDWREREKLLKASFPFDLHAPHTSAEIQFGHVRRPTHVNTSWESAKFEVCAHRWVHVGEPGFGAALITDSTYGYDAGRTGPGTGPGPGSGSGHPATTVRLSLLRAPRSPDPEADQGAHAFTYSLLVGAQVADAVEHGYRLNLPLQLVPADAGAPVPPPLVSLEGGSGVVEAVKLADDGSGDLVVRVYESLGARTTSLLRAGVAIGSAVLCDLLEEPLEGGALDVQPTSTTSSATLRLRPFGVLTVRLRRA